MESQQMDYVTKLTSGKDLKKERHNFLQLKHKRKKKK